MAAVVVVPNPAPAPSLRPHRPDLRVLPGGRAGAPSIGRVPRAVYWRRRAVALLLAGLLVALLALAAIGVRSLLGEPGQASPAPAPAAAAPAAVTGDTYVVQPGDTIWTIARRLQPDGDVRPVVDELVERAGGSVLQPGQRLDVDGLVG